MLDKIIRPTLLIDKKKVISNIDRMKSKFDDHGMIFRPHFKTHQSALVSELFKSAGVEKITVSSFEMAEFFIKQGWKDITVAFPINIREIKLINRLAKKINLNILIENREAVIFLEENLKSSVGVFLKIDTGYHRTGIEQDQFHFIADLILFIQESKRLNIKGLITHAGNTYQCKNFSEVEKIHYQQIKILKDIKQSLGHQYEEILLSLGDTPSCSMMDDFPGVDEVRPGNFVYYDLMQKKIGACENDDIAVCIAAPVVSKHSSRNEVVVYGGGVHLSKEKIELDGNEIFGLPVLLSDDGWSAPLRNSYVRSISQEHGIIKVDPEYFNEIEIGSLIGILPVHSCMTANLLKDNTQFIS